MPQARSSRRCSSTPATCRSAWRSRRSSPARGGAAPLESQLIVDESWALAGRSGRFEYGVLVGAGLLLYVVWVGGTALGTVIGDLLDPEAIGLDAAFPALFLALLAPYLRNRRALVTALVAGGITLVLLPFAPPGVPIVAASLAALIGLLR